MNMYYGTTTNFVCNQPVSQALNHLSGPKPKEHHWYDAFKFWTAEFWSKENVLHNLVMVGEIVGGIIAAPFTGGGSAAAAIAATAAVETGIGLVGAAVNTGIDYAFGHGSALGTGVNFGTGIFGGLAAGGFQYLGNIRRAIRMAKGKGLKWAEKYTQEVWAGVWEEEAEEEIIGQFGIKELFETNEHLKTLSKNEVGHMLSKRYRPTLIEMFKDEVEWQGWYGGMTLGGLHTDEFLTDFAKNATVKGFQEAGQREINYSLDETLTKVGFKGAKSLLLNEFKKLTEGIITKEAFQKFLMKEISESDVKLFEIAIKDLSVNLSTGEIPEYVAKEILNSERFSLKTWFKNTWNNIKHPFKVVHRDFKAIRKAEGWREKLKQLKKALSSAEFNESWVQKGQLSNVTDAAREIARTPYLWIRSMMKKGWAKIARRFKWLQKFSKIAKAAKEILSKRRNTRIRFWMNIRI